MKSIVSKKDVGLFISNFKNIADYDHEGGKYYFVFEDMLRKGSWTLMFYETGKWTIHGKGAGYCDEGEKELPEQDLINFIYKNRKYINTEIKKKNKVVV